MLKAIYDYFMNYGTKPVIVESDIPKGEYDEMLKDAQKEPVIEWLEEFVYVGTGVVDYATTRLYEYYIDYCKREHVPFPLQKLQFTTRLGMRKYDGLTGKVKWINGKATRVWSFDFTLLKTALNVEADDMVLGSDDEVI